MSVGFDPKNDLADIVDGLEAVTLIPRGANEGTIVVHALARMVSLREAAASGGQYSQADVRWHLPVEEQTTRPGLGDVILDADGTRWTVLEVEEATLGTRWGCICRDLAMAFGLDDTITVLKAVWIKGTGGAGEPTWTVWKTGIRARIQPDQTDVGTQLEARRTVKTVLIYVAESCDLDHTHRIKGQDGTLYKVTGSTAADRIGELQTISAEVTPWPLS